MIPVRNAIVEVITAEDFGFRTVEGHDGDFDLQEIMRHFGRGTAARVVCLGVPDIEAEADMPVARVRWGVFVAAQSRTAADPEGQATPGDVALALATKVMALVMHRGQRWNDTAYRAPENVRMQNLYSGRLSKRGLALWVVRWDQLVEIDERMASDLAKLVRIHTKWELSEISDGSELETRTTLEE